VHGTQDWMFPIEAAYMAEAEHISKDDCINEILNKVAVP